MTPQHIVILGGGFGGLYAAMELEKRFAPEKTVTITLVNRDNFFLFTPMLHEVAGSDLDITDIVNPIRKLLKRTTFFKGDVESLDLASRRLTVSHGDEHHHHDFTYDHLVLSLGTIANFYNLPGLNEHALTMKSLGDAIFVRNALIDALEEADFECCADEREPLLTVVVAGGGFSGVETVASINDFLRTAIRSYRNLHEDHLRVVLVHPGPLILPELGGDLGAYAQKKLAARKVEIRVNTRVLGMTAEGVQLNDGTVIKTNTLVWTAGTAPHPIVESLPCGKEKGRVAVNEFLEVPGYPGVWAVGDCACIPDRKTGKSQPPTAQHALREGRLVAHNIAAAIQGQAKKPFTFSTLGQLAAIGRRTGVARILGVNFSGFIAWWLWRTIYWVKLPRLEKKVRVALNWTLDVVFSKDLVQFLTVRSPTVSHEQEKAAEPAVPAETTKH